MLAPVSRAARFRDQLQSTATKRTRSSPTEVTWARAVRRSPPSHLRRRFAIFQRQRGPAAWSLELWVLRRHPPYVPPYPYSPRALCMGDTPDAAADDLRIISYVIYRASPGAFNLRVRPSVRCEPGANWILHSARMILSESSQLHSPSLACRRSSLLKKPTPPVLQSNKYRRYIRL